MTSKLRLLKSNRGFTLTEVMVSVGLIGILSIINLTMLSENMKSQRTADEGTAATRNFQAIASLLADRDICSGFIGNRLQPGEPLPGPFVDAGNNPRLQINDARQIGMMPAGAPVMFETEASNDNAVYDNKVKIRAFYLESYRPSAAGTKTVKLVVVFKPSTLSYLAAAPDKDYVYELMINVTSDDGAPNRIIDCWAGS